MRRPGPGRQRESAADKRARKAAVDDPAVVLDAALRFLEARPRSVHEVRRRLADAGYRAELIDGAVERLLALGILDDQAFARAWVESRDRAHPRGERALRRELWLKGIDRDVADPVIAERAEVTTGPGDPAVESTARPDEEAARRLLARHERALARVADPRARRQRAYALLARNGFDPDVASTMSATLVRDTSSDDE